MPHPDNTGWMSLLLGRPVERPRRTSLDDLTASRKVWDLEHLNVDLPPMREVHDEVTIAQIDGRRLTAEVYVPDAPPPLPAYLHLHGGGWSAGSARNERKLAMRIAQTGYLTVNLDYALAPEHPFPTALQDCVRAARWALEEGPSLGAPGRVLAVGGQSAGANLAAATVSALSPGVEHLRAELGIDPPPEGLRFSALLLVSGILSLPLLLSEPGSNIGPAELWHLSYLGPNFTARNRHPLVSPLFAANLDVFPPTYLSCGCEDSLLGHTLAMTKALAWAGVPTTASIVENADHAHVQLDHVLPSAARELERMTLWMREHRPADG